MTPQWTPFVLNVILHYYACCDEFREAPILDSVFDQLVECGLATRLNPAPGQSIALTEKGRCFVEDGLLQTPLPVWGMPR